MAQTIEVKGITTTTETNHDEQEDSVLAAQRAKNEAARRLLKKWLSDESGYDERTWPTVKALMEEHRLSDRRPFGDEQSDT
jgi:hypothetical protein